MITILINLNFTLQVTPIIVVEILLVLNVRANPFSRADETRKISKRDVENVVSSLPIKLIPPAKIERLQKFASMKNLPVKFRLSDNSSFMRDLDAMFSSLERELEEMLNNTKTKLSEGFGSKDEFFSFFDSDSDSKSEEETEPPEAAEE